MNLDLDFLYKLKLVMEETMTFPSSYLFKFIVPESELSNFKNLVENFLLNEKASKNGKFISVSFTGLFNSSEDIIEIYEKVSNIKGIISL